MFYVAVYLFVFVLYLFVVVLSHVCVIVVSFWSFGNILWPLCLLLVIENLSLVLCLYAVIWLTVQQNLLATKLLKTKALVSILWVRHEWAPSSMSVSIFQKFWSIYPWLMGSSVLSNFVYLLLTILHKEIVLLRYGSYNIIYFNSNIWADKIIKKLRILFCYFLFTFLTAQFSLSFTNLFCPSHLLPLLQHPGEWRLCLSVSWHLQLSPASCRSLPSHGYLRVQTDHSNMANLPHKNNLSGREKEPSLLLRFTELFWWTHFIKSTSDLNLSECKTTYWYTYNLKIGSQLRVTYLQSHQTQSNITTWCIVDSLRWSGVKQENHLAVNVKGVFIY